MQIFTKIPTKYNGIVILFENVSNVFLYQPTLLSETNIRLAALHTFILNNPHINEHSITHNRLRCRLLILCLTIFNKKSPQNTRKYRALKLLRRALINLSKVATTQNRLALLSISLFRTLHQTVPGIKIFLVLPLITLASNFDIKATGSFVILFARPLSPAFIFSPSFDLGFNLYVGSKIQSVVRDS